MRLAWDIESNGLLDHTSIDYLSSPYKLKDSFKIHCIVAKDIDTGQVFKFVGEEVKTKFPSLIAKATMLIAHNQIDFDLLAIKLYLGIDYEIADQCTVNGKPVEIIDTLVLSKVLNPDRYGGHSLDEWGKRLGLEKIDWRTRAIELGLIDYSDPKGAEFQQYHPEMLTYNERDVDVNTKLYWYLKDEMGDWDWQDAFTLEQCVRDIITRQSHRGFWFNQSLANANVRDLDEKMESIRQIVEPLLPPKPMGKTAIKSFLPPKIQFKKNGEISAVMLKWIEKHQGMYTEDNGKYVARFYGEAKVWALPMDCEVPIRTHEPSTVKDTTHIKGWLVSLGWRPTQYKERDLTCDTKKRKLPQDKFEETVRRYVEQTLSSPFCRDRCVELEVKPSKLLDKLLAHDMKRPLKVYTNPTITVGMEKEIDPALLELADKFPHAKLVSEYLTYAHRRNSILGGGVDPDEFDDDDEFVGKGFMAAERISVDGRIPTPADSCGAGTSRFKHRLVANVPRVTSLYGAQMRGLFGVDVEAGFVQMGYDFSSLEAMIESHYCWRYDDEDKAYCNSLTMEKPNDVHTKTAKKIEEVIGQPFTRTAAKPVKYACLPTDSTQVLTRQGWKDGKDVLVGETVLGYNKDTQRSEWTQVTATHLYENADVIKVGHTNWQVESTPDHRWHGEIQRQLGSSKNKGAKKWVPHTLQTQEFKQTFNILNVAEASLTSSNVSAHQAGFIGWLLADGYYKWSELPEGKSSSGGKKKGLVASVAQASHKFQPELEHCLRLNNLDFTVDMFPSVNENVMLNYRLKGPQVRALLDEVVGSRKQKHEVDWVGWILKLDKAALESFLHSFWLADGDQNTRDTDHTVIRQNYGNIADAVVLAGYLLGYNVTQRGSGRISTIRFQKKRKHTTCQRFTELGTRRAQVFCLTTPLDSFVIRQGGIITITGNCAYGAQPKRVAKTVGCSEELATLIHKAYWEAAKPLGALNERLQAYWKTTGEKKFILGLDGRKVPTRSASALINSLFQSSGVICAKMAMVIHERKLRAAGLIVDFFKDDWRSMKFVQQLIGYHDEAQMEMHKSLVKWKLFATEEEAKAFKAENKGWSEIGHSEKGYFIGHCLAGTLIQEAVIETSRYYNLNVTLAADYILGRNWAECH